MEICGGGGRVQDTAAKGITARNQLIGMTTASQSDLMKEHPEHRVDARQDLPLLYAPEDRGHEAEIGKIKSRQENKNQNSKEIPYGNKNFSSRLRTQSNKLE